MRYKERHYFTYSGLSNELKKQYYKIIIAFLRKLTFEYPNFYSWYQKNFSSNFELRHGREIIICEVGYQLAAVAILKYDFQERKICTFRVEKKYRNQGIGKQMMQLCFEWLDTEKPMITLHKSKLNQFSKLLGFYDFKLEQSYKGYYNLFSTELVYNGALPKKEKIELLDFDYIFKKFKEQGKLNFDEFYQYCIEYWLEREQYRQFELENI